MKFGVKRSPVCTILFAMERGQKTITDMTLEYIFTKEVIAVVIEKRNHSAVGSISVSQAVKMRWDDDTIVEEILE